VVGVSAQTPKPIRIEPQPNQNLRLSWPSRSAPQLIYQISFSKDGKELWKKQTPDTTLLFTEANKVLQSAQVYQLSVTALDVLTGKQEVLVANQNWQAPAVCAMPTGLSLQSDGPAALLINWDKRDAYQYQVRHRVFDAQGGGRSPWRVSGLLNKGQLSLPQLLPGSTYQVQVQRNCVWGQSEWADAGVMTVAALPTTASMLTENLCSGAEVPLAELCPWLMQVDLHQSSADQITLHWPKVPANWIANGATLTLGLRYRVQGSGTWTTKNVALAELCEQLYSLPGLTPCTTYEIELQASHTLGGNTNQCVWSALLPAKTTCNGNPEESGPIWVETPPNLILNCGERIPETRPTVTDLCNGLSLTFADKTTYPDNNECSKLIERTWIAIDDCGKSNTHIQNIRYEDKEAPRFITVPQNATLPFGGPIPEENPTVTDNCEPGKVVLSLAVQKTIQPNQEVVVKTWTATDACGNTNQATQTIIFQKEPEAIPPVELDYECGVPDDPKPPISNPLPTAKEGEVVYAYGLPIRLSQVSGGGGNFSGKGLMTLPFGKKQVFVEFANVSIDAERWIVNGNVSAVPSPNFELPQTDPIGSNRPMCVPPPREVGFDKNGISRATGLRYDEHGFDVNSDYTKDPPYPGYQSGDPYTPDYDPNGFDADGNHVVTQSKYNEDGCSQEGVDKDGNKCNPSKGKPYYWLTSGPAGEPTEAGIAVANTYKGHLRPEVDRALRVLDSLNQIQIQAKALECNGLRAEIRTLAGGTAISDTAQIFGIQGEYLSEGMHSRFSTKPKEMMISLAGRPQGLTYLENKHVKLYECDESWQRLIDVSTIIQRLRESVRLDELVTQLLETLRRLPSAEADKIKTWEAFRAWVEAEVKKIVDSRKVATSSFGYLEQPVAPWNYTPAPRKTIPDYLLSRAPYPLEASLVPNFSLSGPELRKQQMAFEFQQGFATIAGMDRAYYLDAIDEARVLAGVEGEDEETLLPITIEKTLGGVSFKVLIDKITVGPTGASADFYAVFPVPGSDSKLAFKATGVNFGPWGAAAETKLSLANDIYVPIGNAMRLVLEGNDDTYVKFDCEGFSGMNVSAYIEICRDYLVPLNSSTLEPLPAPERIKINIDTWMASWDDFFFGVNIPAFAIAGAEDYKFGQTTAFLDLSDTRAVDNMEPPKNYPSAVLGDASTAKLWKGLYIEEISCTMPKGLGGNGNTPLVIQGYDLIIDDNGFTGTVGVTTPILTLEQGNLGGWNFSIDKISVSFVANRLTGGAMQGLVNVPLFGGPTLNPADCFEYVAAITAKDYRFSIKVPEGDRDADIWKAKVKLHAGSKIDISSEADGTFYAIATLNADVTIGAAGSTGDTPLNLPQMSFKGLQVANKAPYFSPGQWSLSAGDSKANLGGFSLVVTTPRMVAGASADEAALAIGITVTVSDDAKISATGALRLIGKLNTTGDRQRWVYNRLEVDKLGISGSFPGVEHLKGSVEFYRNHTTYGKGFRGAVDVKFSAVEVQVKAVAQFGRMDSYGYFLVDALATFSPGIPAGPININGFGGGVYYHMARPDASPGLGATPAGIGDIGTSLSGITYTPDVGRGLGFKATVVFSAQKENVFNANATLEVAFNSKEGGGGLASIWFYGTAQFMNPVDLNILPDAAGAKNIQTGGTLSKPVSPAPICGLISMQYNFNAKIFHADVEVFVTSPGLTGQGKAEIHFEPGKWYIYIGKPDPESRVNLKMKAGPTFIDIGAYLNAGTVLEPMPPLPANVTQILGGGPYGLSANTRNGGGGFAFGASLSLGTSVDAGIVFLSMQADLGFDVMIQDKGNSTCVGQTGKIGINGWYASGQVYAAMTVKGGVKFGRKRFNVIDVSVAALLQGEMPNPFFARGAVGGEFRILGGLVKGKFNAKFTLGEKCELAEGESEQTAYEIIQSINPGQGEKGVSVAQKPEIVFAVPVNTISYFVDENGAEIKLDVKLEKAALTLEDDREIYTFQRFSADKKTLELDPGDMLPPNKTLKIKLRLMVGELGQTLELVEKTVTFTTGDALKEIPTNNIALSYPLLNMAYFHPEEWRKQEGFIQLRSGQPDLLFNLPSGQKLEMVLLQGSAEVQRMAATYDPIAKKLSFPLPAAALQNGKPYNLKLTISGGEKTDQALCNLNFKTSVYRRFADKLFDFAETQNVSNQGETVSICGKMNELFEAAEVTNTQHPSLILATGELENTEWYLQFLHGFYDRAQPYLQSSPARQTDGRLPLDAVRLTTGACVIYDVFNEIVKDYELVLAKITGMQNLEAVGPEPSGGNGGNPNNGPGGVSEDDAGGYEITAFDPHPIPGVYTIKISYRLPDGTITTIGKISFSKQ